MILKIVLMPAMKVQYVHWSKSANESDGKPEQKLDAAFGTICRISKCFLQEASRNFNFYIYLSPEQSKGRLKSFKNHLRMYRKCYLIILALKKYASGDPVLLKTEIKDWKWMGPYNFYQLDNFNGVLCTCFITICSNVSKHCLCTSILYIMYPHFHILIFV